EPLTRLQHRRQGLGAGHRSESHAVLRNAGYGLLQPLERREVVLAQRNEHPVIAARKVEAFGRGLILLQLRLELLRGAVLYQVRELGNETRGTRAAEVITLGESEDLLELIEDQKRNERPARLITQHVIAMVQELPQRLALYRHPGLGPFPRSPSVE